MDSGPPSDHERATRLRRLHLALINLAGLALAVALLHGEFNEWGGDNVTFLALAESLADGDGYVDRFLPVPVPHTRYPPLFPLMLLPWVALGASLLVIKAFVAVLSVAGLNLAYLYLTRTLRPSLAVLACLATLGCGVFLDAGFSVMSDGPYLLVSFAALLLLDDVLREEQARPGRWLLAGLLVGLAVLTRTVGLTLLPALGAAALLGASRLRLPARLGRGLAAGLMALLVMGLWHGRSLLPGSPPAPVAPAVVARDAAPADGGGSAEDGRAPDSVAEEGARGEAPGPPAAPAHTLSWYAADFGKRADGAPGDASGISGGGRSLLERPWLNVRDLWTRAWYAVLPGFIERAGPSATWWTRRLLMGLLLVLGAASALGLLRGVLLRRRIADLYGAIYCLLLLFWIGGGPRLLLPILPLLVTWVAEGLGLLARGACRLRQGWDGTAAAARTELATLTVVLVLDLAVTFGAAPMRQRLAGSPDGWWGRFLRMVDVAAEVLPADALLVTAPAVLPYQRHGLHAVSLRDLKKGGAQQNLDALLAQGADALILNPFLRYYTGQRVHRMVERFPERFELIAEDGEVKLLRLVRRAGDG